MARYFKVVLLINPSRRYTQGLLSGITKYSQTYGGWNYYRPLNYRVKGEKENLTKFLQDLKPDGILMREPPQMAEIIEMNIPTVIVPYTQASFPKMVNVVADHIGVGEMAAEHFLERGYHHFAYIGFEDWWWSLKRKEGFTKKVQQAGYDSHTYRSKSKRLKLSDEVPQIVDWLRSLPKPIAIMGCNDDRGEMVIEACKVGTLMVPDEVSVLGVDNDQLICDLCNPPLSSIALNLEKSGYEAARVLDQLMSKELESPHDISIVPTHVITRRSTDILAIEDKEVVTAVRFIRENTKLNLCVTDVVEYAALSRRVLEKRFRKYLHRSIHGEIKRNRINLMEKMLQSTSLSIMKIAHDLNFDDVTHFSRYFRVEKGISPKEYRKKYCT